MKYAIIDRYVRVIPISLLFRYLNYKYHPSQIPSNVKNGWLI